MKSIDVLVLGGTGVDTIVYVPELPLPFADSYPVPTITTRAGQTGDFTAVALAALGHRVHHLDTLGADHEGDLVRAMHRDAGIPLTEVPEPAGTRRAVNLVDPQGRRLSLYDNTRHTDGGELPPDLVVELARTSRHVHVSITQPCAAALPLLADLDVTLSTDLHNWDGANPYHEQFAAAVDVVFVSATALADPEATMRRVAALGRPSVVVATDGAAGARQLVGGEVRFIAPVPPRAPAVDSNGAGDAFAAAYLTGWLAEESPERCGVYGAVAGAYACTVPSTAIDPISLTRLRELAS
jgi:sugar/nucleoside kinase (ribokinase family)